MKVFFAALFFFLIAFAGLAVGLILKRRGLRGGCSSSPGADHDCKCKSATDPNMQGEIDRCTAADENPQGEV